MLFRSIEKSGCVRVWRPFSSSQHPDDPASSRGGTGPLRRYSHASLTPPLAQNAPITITSDSSPGPFEGPEKLLELWFAPSEQHVAERGLPIKGGRKGKGKWIGLRQIERRVWDSMLDEVQCKVLSVIEGEDVDAYLLR